MKSILILILSTVAIHAHADEYSIRCATQTQELSAAIDTVLRDYYVLPAVTKELIADFYASGIVIQASDVTSPMAVANGDATDFYFGVHVANQDYHFKATVRVATPGSAAEVTNVYGIFQPLAPTDNPTPLTCYGEREYMNEATVVNSDSGYALDKVFLQEQAVPPDVPPLNVSVHGSVKVALYSFVF